MPVENDWSSQESNPEPDAHEQNQSGNQITQSIVEPQSQSSHESPELMNSPDKSNSELLTSSQLRALEAESIHIIREVVAEFERPGLLFSGGKDSIIMLHLAVKALRPAKLLFPIVHIDTGHNFPEAIEYRDRTAANLGIELVIGSVPDALDLPPIALPLIISELQPTEARA
jgi:3'-phosphoadenosine 5'-phosphosulfate sulfotransferase (PAPS reductase)/FAD synthetase